MKFLKLKLHHLSYYYINLYDDYTNVQFLMYNYNDTSDNKKFKVCTKIEIDITPSRVTKTIVFLTTQTQVNEPCSPECYKTIRVALEDNIDSILTINKQLKILKKNAGKYGRLSYEAKQQIKREKKQLENNRSIFKENLKNLLKELFEKPVLVSVAN